jgi:hypothetical protein
MLAPARRTAAKSFTVGILLGVIAVGALAPGCRATVVTASEDVDLPPPKGGAIGQAVPPTSACAPEGLCMESCERGVFACGQPSAVCVDACRFARIRAGSCIFCLDDYFTCAMQQAVGSCARDTCAALWDEFSSCMEEERNNGFPIACTSGTDCCCEEFSYGIERTEDCDTTGACACYEEGVFKGACQEWEGAHDPIFGCGVSDGCCAAFFSGG